MLPKNFVFVMLLLFVISCKNEKKPDRQKPDSVSVDSVFSSEKNTVEKLEIEPPEWYKNVPTEAGFLYAIGTGLSGNLTMAEEKAMLRAQRLMAEKYEQLSIKPAEERKAAGGAEDASELSGDLTQELSNSFVKEKKRVKVGSRWRVFILLEMEIGDIEK